MSERRVVITGMGVLSPVGNDMDTFWTSLVEGKSGIGKVESLDHLVSAFIMRFLEPNTTSGEIKRTLKLDWEFREFFDEFEDEVYGKCFTFVPGKDVRSYGMYYIQIN